MAAAFALYGPPVGVSFITWSIASGLMVLMPAFPLFKIVSALLRILGADPLPMMKTGSARFHCVDDIAVVSLYLPITKEAYGLANAFWPAAIEASPLATEPDPMAVDSPPEAIVPFPKAVETTPVAELCQPMAVE